MTDSPKEYEAILWSDQGSILSLTSSARGRERGERGVTWYCVGLPRDVSLWRGSEYVRHSDFSTAPITLLPTAGQCSSLHFIPVLLYINIFNMVGMKYSSICCLSLL